MVLPFGLREIPGLLHEHDRCVRIADAEDYLAATQFGERASLAIVKRVGEFLEGDEGVRH